MKIAVAAGAEAVSLIPRNDGVATERGASRTVTETALREILPMLQAHGLKAMVETEMRAPANDMMVGVAG